MNPRIPLPLESPNIIESIRAATATPASAPDVQGENGRQLKHHYCRFKLNDSSSTSSTETVQFTLSHHMDLT